MEKKDVLICCMCYVHVQWLFTDDVDLYKLYLFSQSINQSISLY